MKKTLSAVLIIGILFSTTLLSTGAYSIFNVHQNFASSTLRAMENDLGIKTKEDAEVFTIVGNADSFNFTYAAETGELLFTADTSVMRSISQDAKTELNAVNSGFRVNTTILEDVAPTSYKLNVALPNTWTIDYARQEDGSIANGSLGIYNEFGEPVASTGLVTAVDAAGNELDAELAFDYNSITMCVNNENAIYPIETSYGIYATNAQRSLTDYFHYAGFNLVYDGSLTIGPRYFDEGSVIDCTNGWNAVYDLFYPYSPYWTNSTQTQSLNDQYWCHADFAKNKSQWNLEPWRPVVSWATMIMNSCNPE